MPHCPWTYRAISISGNSFLPCCQFQGRFVIKDNDLEFEYQHGKISDLRTRLNNGEQVSECNECWVSEKMGLKSMRQQGLDIWGEVTVPEIRYAEFDLDNTCNLKCVSCSSRQSSALISDEIKLYGKNVFAERIVTDHFKLIDFSKLEVVKLFGGEPFLSKNITELCDSILNSDISNNIELWINTNCTVLPNSRVKELILNCKHLNLSLSIDGYKDLNNFVRNDTKWEDVLKNLIEFEKYIDQRPPSTTNISINYVAHLYNVNKIHEVRDWQRENFPRFNFNITPLLSPIFLSFINAPKEYKKYLEKYFNQQNLQHLNPYLNEPDNNLFDYFLAYHKMIVDLRQQDIESLNPELFEYMKNYIPTREIDKDGVYSLRSFDDQQYV